MNGISSVAQSNTVIISPYQSDDEDFSFFGCYVFSHKGNNLLLNRENGTIIFLNDDLLNEIKLKSPSDDLQFKLIQRGFAQTSNSPKCSLNAEKILPRFFLIDITSSCNFRCSYCFRRLPKGQSFISDGVLDRICDYIISYCKKYGQEYITIQPWGGEPLLAFSKIKRIQDQFARANLYPVITIETNGSLITPNLAAELHERNIHVGISIDGLPQVHDSQRYSIYGKATFSRVLKGLLNLHNSGIGNNFSTISVITKNSLAFLEETLDFFSKDLGLNSIKFNIIRDNPSLLNKNLLLEPEYVVAYIKRFLKKIVELHKEGYEIIEGNISEKLCNILLRQETNICISKGCMGGRSIISFNNRGLIFPCEMIEYKEEVLGSIDDGVDLIDLIREASKKNEYFAAKYNEECKECPWWYFCRGGCTATIKYERGIVQGVDTIECLVNKVLYPELIKLIFEEPSIINSLAANKVNLSWRE